jgi:hypothetical protein
MSARFHTLPCDGYDTSSAGPELATAAENSNGE